MALHMSHLNIEFQTAGMTIAGLLIIAITFACTVPLPWLQPTTIRSKRQSSRQALVLASHPYRSRQWDSCDSTFYRHWH